MDDHIKHILFGEIQRLFIEQKETENNIEDLLFISSKYPFLFNIIQINEFQYR